MSVTTDLLDRALALSPQQQADMARQLLLSLEGDRLEDPAEVGKAWSEEIDAGLDRADAGQSAETDWRVAVERARKSVGI